MSLPSEAEIVVPEGGVSALRPRRGTYSGRNARACHQRSEFHLQVAHRCIRTPKLNQCRLKLELQTADALRLRDDKSPDEDHDPLTNQTQFKYKLRSQLTKVKDARSTYSHNPFNRLSRTMVGYDNAGSMATTR